MDKVVVSIGGSVLIPEKDDAIYIKKLADMLSDVAKKVELIVVCGGGKVARYYTETGRAMDGSIFQLDELGIGITRVNAGLLTIALGDSASYKKIPHTVDTCVKNAVKEKVTVMGGTVPGHTTDAVAAMIARKWGADRIVNASNVEAVYSADPRKDPNAKRFSTMTIDELKAIVYDKHDAGRSSVFDPLGVKIAKQCQVDLLMVNGRDFEELENGILGKKIKGTFVNSH